jgi:predicted ATPase
MQSQLIVKNFGPIKSVNLDLKNVNVFIGPQASGKSALAKIYTIFKAPRKFLGTKAILSEIGSAE